MSNDNPERVLSIPAKKSVPVELYRPLRRLVATKYSESHAQKLEGVLETLNKCRMDMVEQGDLSLVMQRDCLIHYFKCLCMVEPLFADISADTNPIIFIWHDAFNSEHVSSQHNSIQLEKAAVLFNLGAIYSQIGACCDRTTALGLHFAMDAFNAAANFFLKLWKVFAKDVSATLDLTLLFAESLHHIFSAQASELRLQQQLDDNDRSAFQQYDSVYKLYLRAQDLIRSDSAAIKHVDYFDQTLVTHLSHKAIFFHGEALRRQSPKSELPALVQSITLDDDAESVTEKLLRGICCLTSLLPSCRLDHDADSFGERILSYASKPGRQRPKIPYIDLLLSEHCPFKIIEDGKLVVKQWDMPPPYPTNSAILSSSHMLAIPLKKSEPLNLYEPLRSYVVLKYSENEAKRVEDLFKMVDKLRSDMQRDDLPLLIRRDCLIRYFELLCMIECLFPMTNSPNPPIFIWYNSFNPQQHSCQHNIHLEKASVLFNLGALCTNIAISCNLTTNQGRLLPEGTLNDASFWFFLLQKLEAEKASATMDLSVICVRLLRGAITNQLADLKYEGPRSCPRSDLSSFYGHPVAQHYYGAYNLSNVDPSWMPELPELLRAKIESMKPMRYIFGPIDITEEFLLGYCDAQSLLQDGCQTPCLDLLCGVGSFKIKDGNLVANL